MNTDLKVVRKLAKYIPRGKCLEVETARTMMLKYEHISDWYV